MAVENIFFSSRHGYVARIKWEGGATVLCLSAAVQVYNNLYCVQNHNLGIQKIKGEITKYVLLVLKLFILFKFFTQALIQIFCCTCLFRLDGDVHRSTAI